MRRGGKPEPSRPQVTSPKAGLIGQPEIISTDVWGPALKLTQSDAEIFRACELKQTDDNDALLEWGAGQARKIASCGARLVNRAGMRYAEKEEKRWKQGTNQIPIL